MGFGSLYIPVSGMSASRYSLNTISHNITNSNNPHYVRQSAMHASNRYSHIREGIDIGTGVSTVQIRQIRDKFLDIQLRNELPEFGYHYAKAETLADVEGVFNEITNSGLQEVMNEFWNSWNELAKDPESLAARALVHEGAVAYTDTVNHIGDQLLKIQRNLNTELEVKFREVNDLLEGIAELNEQIVIFEAEGPHVSANDFRDERNAMIDRLTQLLPVQTTEDHRGSAIVSLNGRELVDMGHVTELVLKPDPEQGNGYDYVYWGVTNEKIDLKGRSEIGGFIDVRDTSVRGYMEQMDYLVREMAEKVNDLHKKGYGLGIENQNEIPFFVTKDGSKDSKDITAINIRVNPELADLNKISVSASGKKGDGEIGKAIYGLRSEKMLFKWRIDVSYKDGKMIDQEGNDIWEADKDKYGNLQLLNGYNLNEKGDILNKSGNVVGEKISIDEFYRDLVTTLGLEREASIDIAKHQDFLIRSIDGKRSSLSDVSLDEEMADMLRFQHAYTANSRVFNTIDEMLDVIVNRLGVVGR